VETLTRVCLLTGASGFLGRGIIEALSPHYNIAAIYNQHAIGSETPEEYFFDPLIPRVSTHHTEYSFFPIKADLTDSNQIKRSVDQALTRFGHVDLLINGAAIRAFSHLIAPNSLDSAERLFSVNFFGPLRMALELANRNWRYRRDENIAHNRNIINVSSSAGLYVYPDLGQALYGSSKAALNHLTYHLANEFWDLGIRVNAVAPDSFPSRVSLDGVIEALLRLDHGDQTGQVVPVV
jgi:NAD(P)-dependent dehydrogenase (short-subunit alcohol dehydrogenase family)